MVSEPLGICFLDAGSQACWVSHRLVLYGGCTYRRGAADCHLRQYVLCAIAPFLCVWLVYLDVIPASCLDMTGLWLRLQGGVWNAAAGISSKPRLYGEASSVVIPVLQLGPRLVRLTVRSHRRSYGACLPHSCPVG